MLYLPVATCYRLNDILLFPAASLMNLSPVFTQKQVKFFVHLAGAHADEPQGEEKGHGGERFLSVF